MMIIKTFKHTLQIHPPYPALIPAVVWMVAGFCSALPVGAQIELIRGAAMAQKEDAEKQKKTANPRIDSSWGPAVQGLSVKLDQRAKRNWGSAEVPTFILEVRNTTDREQELQLSPTSLQLVVDQKRYAWNAHGTRLIASIPKNGIRENLFVLRLSELSWTQPSEVGAKPAEEKSVGAGKRLTSLAPGDHEVEIRILPDAAQPNAWLSTGKIKVGITKNFIELPTLAGTLKSPDGKPIANADIYLCKESQFYVHYSNHDGKRFQGRSVSHYDPVNGSSHRVTPVKTDKDGSFQLNPQFDNKRVVVIPEKGTAQTFFLPESTDKWDLRLKPTASITIEYDIPGGGEFNNASLAYMPTAFASNFIAARKQQFVLRENFNLGLKNGSKLKIDGLKEGNYRLNAYKYLRVGRRSYSVGRINQSVEVAGGEEAAIRLVRDKGQQVSFKVTQIPGNSQYLVVGIFELDQPLSLSSAYSNSGLWTEGASETDKEQEFKSALVPPGKYRLVAMSVPPHENPNSYNYVPDFIGSKVIEVSNEGKINAGSLRLIEVDSWRMNSGMALDAKLVTSNGDTVGQNQYVWPTSVGFSRSLSRSAFRTNTKGFCRSIQPPGSYTYFAGVEQNRPLLFSVQVPRMTPQTVILPDPPLWQTDADRRPDLQITVKSQGVQDEDEDPVLKVAVENKSDFEASFDFGHIHVQVINPSVSGSIQYRVFPPETDTIYRTILKKNSTTEFQFKWRDLKKNGIWTGCYLNSSAFQGTTLKQDGSPAVLTIGPAISKPFFVPELPPPVTKPFR